MRSCGGQIVERQIAENSAVAQLRFNDIQVQSQDLKERFAIVEAHVHGVAEEMEYGVEESIDVSVEETGAEHRRQR